MRIRIESRPTGMGIHPRVHMCERIFVSNAHVAGLRLVYQNRELWDFLHRCRNVSQSVDTTLPLFDFLECCYMRRPLVAEDPSFKGFARNLRCVVHLYWRSRLHIHPKCVVSAAKAAVAVAIEI